MTEEHERLQHDRDESRLETLELLKETDQVLKNAQIVISSARERLQKATQKYEERLYGPQSIRNN